MVHNIFIIIVVVNIFVMDNKSYLNYELWNNIFHVFKYVDTHRQFKKKSKK